jgi:hypothetical protein
MLKIRSKKQNPEPLTGFCNSGAGNRNSPQQDEIIAGYISRYVDRDASGGYSHRLDGIEAPTYSFIYVAISLIQRI